MNKLVYIIQDLDGIEMEKRAIDKKIKDDIRLLRCNVCKNFNSLEVFR